MDLKEKYVSFGLNQINGYIYDTKVDSSLSAIPKKSFAPREIDPSRRLIEPRIWIYTRYCKNNRFNNFIMPHNTV